MQASHAEQKRGTMSIFNRTLIILAAYTLFLVCTIPFGVYYVTNNLNEINQSTIDLDDLRLEVDVINSYFIRQAKDRKNLFLRGHNQKDLEKYRKRVKKMTVKIQESIQKVLENPLAEPYRADLQGFLLQHQKLMNVYDEGVNVFQASEDHTQGDAYVRGMGAETGQELTNVITMIQDRQTKGIVENQQKVQRTMFLTSLVMVAIILIFSIFLTIALIKPIRRIVRFNQYLRSDHQSRGSHYIDSSKKQDEIGYMVDSHNELLKTIEDYSANLENMVDERTSQLEDANNEIKALNQLLQAENIRLSTEVEVTRKIQQMILPKDHEIKRIPELDIAAFMQPANEVGGDYYDILKYGDRIKIGIGDVTGHGLESGVLMLMVQTAVRTLLANDERDVTQFLNTINRTIYDNVQRMGSEKNLTLSLLEYCDGAVTLSGQHEEIIVVRNNGAIERVDTIDLGFPIGLDDDIEAFIDEAKIHMNPGDGLILYTDGVTEAENIDGEQYQIDRLCEVVKENWHHDSEDIMRVVIEDLQEYIGEQRIYDDITLIVVKQKELEKIESIT